MRPEVPSGIKLLLGAVPKRKVRLRYYFDTEVSESESYLVEFRKRKALAEGHGNFNFFSH
jgi:hypothetical protein